MNQEAVPQIPYKDRKTGLTIFGVLTLLVGCLFGLMVPLMTFGQSMAAKQGGPQNSGAFISGMFLYGMLALVLISLGIGSMQARRWARALILIASWSWLIIGCFVIAFMGFYAPQLMETMQKSAPAGQPELPEAAKTATLVFIFAIMGVIFLALPVIWVFFYGSKSVKATCEARDPVVRWTDRSPLPVIAMSAWLLAGVPSCLLMAINPHTALPFFGQFITGPMCMAFCFVLAAIWIYSALALYKLDAGGWWLAFISMALFGISGFLTYWKHDIFELYQVMGYSAEQIAQLQKYSFFQGRGMAWFTAGCSLPWLGYLLYIRKFFRRKE